MSLLRGCAVVSILLALPGLVLAQNLDDILARDRLVLQKLFDEVNGAVEQSRTLQKNEPGKARHVLEGALLKIQSCDVCPEDQRVVLRRRDNTRLAEVNAQARELQVAAEEAARKEYEKFRKDTPAKTPIDVANQKIFTVKDQLEAHKRIRAKQASGNLGVLDNLVASATPIEGSMEFPKYWKTLTDNRKTLTGQKLTEKEVSLLRALNSTLSVDFDKRTFKEVLEYLQEKTGQAIFADEDSLKDVQVEYDTPVTLKVNKVTLRTILRKILADNHLTYVLKEGGIQIVTPQKARDSMVIRAYPIDDLVGTGSPQLYGPFVAYQIRMQNVQTLINNIQNAVEPSIWENNGGPGRITYVEATNALIIRAPAELHYMLGGGGILGR